MENTTDKDQPADKKVLEYAVAIQAKFKEFRTVFKQIFELNLKDYWNPFNRVGLLLGFDVIKFSEILGEIPDEKSYMDYIEEKYGISGANLIQNIMDSEREVYDKSFGIELSEEQFKQLHNLKFTDSDKNDIDDKI